MALGIRYLTGFVAAAQAHDREAPEWPPHPARVFMALAAACLETGGDEDERKALLWLESEENDGEITAPAIAAGGCSPRSVATRFVPVNDKAGPSKALLQTA
ncbi:MAG: type I-U CRISPR-associated protein Cas5/Cas6, partial [Bryobacterales bacterium]|nr:type I-U CRISPR-associated protein Cas5/Cas6 [Bryobacterales bacterium]